MHDFGYYTVPLRSGLRAVVLNSQLGYIYNFYSLLPDRTPLNAMWDWLVAVLSQAEKDGERVIIASHMPPGRNDILNEFGTAYTNLSVRFAKTIVGHFGGHIHSDAFEVFSDPSTGAAAGTYYCAPSVTTFTNHNPSFRIYEADAATFTLRNFQQYHMNLTRANLEGAITWELFYDAAQVWGIQDISPASWQKVCWLCCCLCLPSVGLAAAAAAATATDSAAVVVSWFVSLVFGCYV